MGALWGSYLRYVWREVNDGNGTQKMLLLQYWNDARGEWKDVPISITEPNDLGDQNVITRRTEVPPLGE